MSEESDRRRDALARVIDPQSWKLYDVSGMEARPAAQGILVRESRKAAERVMDSGLMEAFEWDSKEYLKALERIKRGTSRTGKCQTEPDFKHDPKCHRWPDTAMSGTGCIR